MKRLRFDTQSSAIKNAIKKAEINKKYYMVVFNHVTEKFIVRLKGKYSVKEELVYWTPKKEEIVRVKYLSSRYQSLVKGFPNFHKSGSTKEMKEKYYGRGALLVRCGQYIYNVTDKPKIYHEFAILIKKKNNE